MAFRLAWGTCALTLLLICVIILLTVLNQRVFDNAIFSVVGVSGVVVGAVVASKRPANPVGWLFLFGTLLFTLPTLADEYAVYGILTEPGAVPLPYAVAWFSNATEFIGPLLIFVLIPLYFPTGRPVSRRWGTIAWLALGVLPVATFLSAFSPGEAINGTGIQNPLVIKAMLPVESVLGPVLFAWYIGLIFASAASLVVRFWRSAGVERQQIKWFTFAAAFIPVWFMTNRPVEAAFPILFQLMDALVIAAVPVAAGIAILRHRLYDIDVIINRAVVYGALSVMLVLVYFGSVVGLQYVFRGLTGQESQLTIVASTLAIAALFNPLRRLIQIFIDRRFYRRKYDARETLEAFAARLRAETDLDSLSGDLASVVNETMQPEHVSLWLQEPENKR
ncbi:MAG: hypothetical protein M3397_02900 [Actinomycetota bacterium]|jgi:hypothetical protein|nr:hypothetical protein [Actinomycetota bacterium]